MPSSDPIVLRRMLALRQFPLFAGVQLDELVTLAENVTERTMVAGERLVAASTRAPTLYFILDGGLETPTQSWRPRDVCGIFEALADRAPPGKLISTGATRSLELPSRELSEILEDNVGVLLAVLRELASRVPIDRMVVTKTQPIIGGGAVLGLVERLILLRKVMPFTRTHLHALARLANACEEVALTPGTIVAHDGEPANRALVIIDGDLQIERDSSSPILGRAATAIGLLETLSGATQRGIVRVVSATRALVFHKETIVEMIDDHSDAGVAMLNTFSNEVLAGPPRTGQ